MTQISRELEKKIDSAESQESVDRSQSAIN
jgi:hypothetical protein